MKKIITVVIFLLISQKLSAYESDTKANSFILNNGMRVIAISNNKIPTVSHMVVYKVGSVQDPIGKSGLAHFLEHMMFKSTAKLKEGDFFRIVSENGGSLNAFTGYDLTGYYEHIARDKLSLVMELEADRMTKLNLHNDEVLKERNVIIQERNLRYDNIPEARLVEQMHASLYINHPNHRPIIGWKHEMENLNLNDVRNFYKKYYDPSNAILIVSGDISLEELKPLAEKYYGKTKTKKIENENRIVEEAPQILARKLNFCDDKVQVENFIRMYQTPKLKITNMEDDVSIDIVKYILAGSKFSRLNKHFIDNKKLANEINISYYNNSIISPGVLRVTIAAKEKIDLSIIEHELNKQIDLLYNYGITQVELEQSKQNFKANHIYEKESFKNLSNIYAFMAVYGVPFSYFEEYSDYIDKVNLEKVNSLIKEIFIPAKSVTGLLFNSENKCKNYVN